MSASTPFGTKICFISVFSIVSPASPVRKVSLLAGLLSGSLSEELSVEDVSEELDEELSDDEAAVDEELDVLEELSPPKEEPSSSALQPQSAAAKNNAKTAFVFLIYFPPKYVCL